MIVYPEDLAKLAVLAGVNIVVIGVAVYAWLDLAGLDAVRCFGLSHLSFCCRASQHSAAI